MAVIAYAILTMTTSTPILILISKKQLQTLRKISRCRKRKLIKQIQKIKRIDEIYFSFFRVMIGIKLTKVNTLIHMQIQEGELLPRGEILEESVQWQDADNFTVMDRNVQNGRDYHSLD